MKNQLSRLLVLVTLLVFNQTLQAQISGVVFRDFNGNGIRTASAPIEPLLAGITVKAFNAANIQLGTTKTTSATGAYAFTVAEIPSGTAVRIEFSGISTGDAPSFNGTGNGTNIQFVTAPSTLTNFAISNPSEYSSTQNPRIAATQFVNNNSAAGNTSRTVFDINYDGTGTPTDLGTRANTGTTWGLTYDKKSKRLFTSAFLKRHAQLGPLGLSGIYEINYTNPLAPVVSNWLDINTLAGVNVGTTNRPAAVNYTIDAAVFGEIGKIGIGDIDLSDNGDTMYVMNLNNNGQLVVINRNTKALIATYAVPNPGCGVAGDVRPFGLKYYRGAVYVGVICSGQTTATNQNFSVYRFVNGTFTAVLSDDLVYPKGWVHAEYQLPTAPALSSSWETWTDDFADINTLGSSALGPRWSRPQAMLTDIEFDVDGTMILGFADRAGFQLGYASRNPADNTTGNGYIGGEILRTTKTGSTFILESNGSANGLAGGGVGNNKGPGGGEFYTGELYSTVHEETSNGGLALLAGSGEVLLTAMDPNTTVFTGGIIKLSNTTGLKTSSYQSYATTAAANATFGKAAGLGDMEILADVQPIQIGNRIWRDTNGDGVQDANETTAGVPSGTTVTLRSPGVNGIYGDADDQTWTTTTDAAGNYYFSALASADNRKPALWTGIGNTILSGYDYRIEVAIPATFNVTKTNANLNSLDNIDNDATASGVNAVVIFNTANTNHNFDIGFKQQASLGNKVWLDQGGGANAQNGVQDADEPGVASVPVNLYRNGADGLPGTADDVFVGSTITDAYGMYLFDNLTATDQTNATTIGQTSYNVRVTPPANYSFTTQTNTTDDNNTTGASTIGSDVNVLGVSYGVNLSFGENNPNIDAGLIFKPAINTNSIGDKVWFDADGNGINANNATEPGVAGITVTLYKETMPGSGIFEVYMTTVTDANGNYIFNGLPANVNFQVAVSAPAGTTLTSGGVLDIANGSTNSDVNPATGKTTTFSSGAVGTQITGIDAGLKNDPKGAIGDFVWNDINNNGIQDAGEPGVLGVTMQLYSPGPDGVVGGGDDVLVATTTTDANGYYNFAGLNPDKYFVVATPVAGYTVSAKDVTAGNPAGDTKDNDFETGVGTYSTSYVSPIKELITVNGAVTKDMTFDLGIHNNLTGLNTLGDKVWNDINKNGLQDGTEVGVANVTVRLLDGAGNPVNNPATGKPYITATDASGMYKFVDLVDGNYMVEFTNLPIGYTFTTQDASGSGNAGSATDGTDDSDAKASNGRTSIIAIDVLSSSSISIDVVNVDAGISQGIPAGTASLGNRVWYDINNNGLQDAGELGVNNVRVELLDAAGVAVNVPGTAIPYVVYTNALGEYLFTSLPAGDYRVRFSSFPIGYTSSMMNIGDDALDADANFAGASIATTTATTATYSLATGEDNLTVDMGIVPPATGSNNSVGNFVWNDTNADGIQSAGEPGVQGVTVTLYTNGADGLPGTVDDIFVAATTTDNNGAYSFVGLADGNYNVGFTNLPAGFGFTDKDKSGSTTINGSDANTGSGRTGTIALDPTSGSATGINNPDVDAGLITTRAALGNYVWIDSNGDGVQDASEKGVSGVTVILYAADAVTVISSTVTNADGKYCFANLTPGMYVVGFGTTPTGLIFTQQITPGDNGINTNSDVNPLTGKTTVIALIAGETDLTVDAGLQPANNASVGNLVWNDTNNDGIQDATEAGVPGILVTLYDATNAVVGVALTDGNGNYNISNIKPGAGYYIVFSNLTGDQAFTGQNVSGSTAANGSDANTGTGQTATFSLNAGQYLPTIDAGIIKNIASLGNKVWLDEGAGGGIAKNGIQDGTEPGVSGVPVNLYQNGVDGIAGNDDDILVASTITDAYGMYLFSNLRPSTNAATQYNVRVTPPSNYSLTTQTNTTDDNNTTGASTTGSDVNVLGVSYSIALSAGENNPNIDAGLIFKTPVLPNSIGDKVWFDVNGDGVNANDATEPGVAGITVTLYDAATGNIVAVTTTDANGNYLFNNLPANTNYQVGFSAPAGVVLTTGGVLDISNGSTNSDANPLTGKTATFSSGAAGTQITGVDAGLKNDPKGAIGDFVWNDTNNNGIQDAGEPGVTGVTMQLYTAGADGLVGGGDDVLVATTSTDANGYYVFPNLDPAKYFVVATPVVGYTKSTENLGSNDTKDCDFGNGAGTYAGLYVSPVSTLLSTAGGVTRDMTIDLGIHSNASNLNTLGNKVWNDLNKDGLQTAGEAGVANVTVRLLNGAGMPVNNATTGKPYIVQTDANGNYKFVDLADGNYMVEFANLPAGFTFTSKDAAGSGNAGSATDTDTDSDASTTTGRTSVIDIDAAGAIATSVNIVSVDAGIAQGTAAGTASLGNRVWYDIDNNGKQDAGELGANNVKVTLLDGLGSIVNVPGTSTPYIVYTNALGEYNFTGLPAGDYAVRFSNLPAGFTSSPANASGVDDVLDADASFAGAAVTATTTATTAVYALLVGEDNLTVDMGLVPAIGTNGLGNYVWSDANNNGIQDGTELGVQGVTVTLYANGADGEAGTADDVVVAVTTTDNNGAYTFVGLPDGNYNVGFTNLPAGYVYTDKNKVGSTPVNGSDASTASGRTTTYALDPTSISATGVYDPTVDGGLISSRAALGNYVWIDTNGDGIQDVTEKGVSGVTVILYATDGTTVLASTITDATGKYYFGNLIPGDYRVGFSTIPNDLIFTQQNTIGDNQNNTNSDAVPATITSSTAITGTINLVAGETDLTVDAGLKPIDYASVGNFVWNDLNGDGKQDANEPGVPGVLVTLYDAITNLPIGTAITDGNGGYLISKIPAAVAGTSFYVIFSNLPGTAVFTTQNSDVTPGDITNGSDANISTGRTANFTLVPGQYLPTVDAGIKNVQLLPLEFVEFTASPKGTNVAIQWTVNDQANIANYEVFTSVDNRTYTSIATQISNGNFTASYNALHTNPAIGVNFYKLKTISNTGKIGYSDVRKVTFGKNGSMIVYPNPAYTSTVNISLTGSMVGKAATITIISMDGKVVYTENVKATNQTETIDISKFANGNYSVKVTTATEEKNTKLEIIK
jgi:protocatechuate 3,4-dioxygenase beta subunit